MRVFVSYKSEDPSHNEWVERLGRDLRARGIDALLDKWEVPYGESFSDYMTRGIHGSDAVLFVMTPAFLSAAEESSGASGPVKFELQLALARRLAGERFRLIGLLRRGDRAVYQLRDLRYADFRDESSYEQSLERLVTDLIGESQKPALVPKDSRDWPFTESAHVGDQLETSGLVGEFLAGSHDLIVWKESTEGPESAVAVYRATSGSYVFQALASVEYATRVRAAAGGCFLVIQEREGIRAIDSRSQSVISELPIASVGDPIIRSDAVHPVLPWVVIGTDYGRIVAWDWREARILFSKHLLPAGEVNWINGLSFLGQQAGIEVLMVCVENVMSYLRVDTGELLSQVPLGSTEETTALAVNGQSGTFAVGGVMDTKVYRQAPQPELLYQVRNSVPLVQDLRFSRDGHLLGIVDGGLGGSGVAVAEAGNGSTVQRFGELWPPSGNAKWSGFSIASRSVSFSDDNRLVAIGQGGRVGIYITPQRRPT